MYYINSMEYKVTIDKDNFSKTVLTILNSGLSLNMHELEIDILATLLKNGITTINAKSRTIIRTTLDKDKFTTNNYIKKLKDKHLLVEDSKNKDLHIHPTIVGAVKHREHSFKFDTVD